MGCDGQVVAVLQLLLLDIGTLIFTMCCVVVVSGVTEVVTVAAD